MSIGIVFYCHYCGVTQKVHFFTSDDNGNTFDHNELPDDFTNYTMSFWDVAVNGDDIYFLTYQVVGPWYNYDYNLLLYTSQDRGQTFTFQDISVLNQSGVSHPYPPFDSPWGYTNKMAVAKDKVFVIWSGLDAENKNRVFIRRSDDRGRTFVDAIALEGVWDRLQTGHETVVTDGDHVYLSFLTNDS